MTRKMMSPREGRHDSERRGCGKEEPGVEQEHDEGMGKHRHTSADTHHGAQGAQAHAHEHGHSHAPALTTDNQRAVLLALVLTAAFLGVEVAGGLLSGSLALIADAGHMLTDVVALALAWAGFHFGQRASNASKTFGYLRLEVLAGFINALTLFGLVLWVAWEAVARLRAPAPVLAGPMFVVALLGLAVNVAVFAILRRADTSHVNIRGAMLHVLGDLLGSVAAIVAAIVIYFTGWMPIDPILSLLIVLLILRSAWALLKNSIHILLEGTPPGIDIARLGAYLVEHVEGLMRVEHVHVWSITSGQPAATLEARIEPEADPRAVTRAIKRTLAEAFGIGHSTVEIVWDESDGCALEARPQAHSHSHE